MLGITNDYEAFCLDECVVYFGLEITREIDKVGEKLSSKDKSRIAQREAKLRSLLQDDQKKRFAAPVATR